MESKVHSQHRYFPVGSGTRNTPRMCQEQCEEEPQSRGSDWQSEEPQQDSSMHGLYVP